MFILHTQYGFWGIQGFRNNPYAHDLIIYKWSRQIKFVNSN